MVQQVGKRSGVDMKRVVNTSDYLKETTLRRTCYRKGTTGRTKWRNPRLHTEKSPKI